MNFYTHISVRRLVIGASMILISLMMIFYLLRGSTKPDHKPVPVVTVEPLKKGDMPIYRDALGTATPLQSITLRTQISGTIDTVAFKEGGEINKGDLLVQIDARPYRAQLQQYQGQLAKDQALLENAKLDLARYENLMKKQAVSKQIMDTQLSLVRQYESAIKMDEALVAQAQLNIDYCHITSPISGRIGLCLVDAGNYVQPNDVLGVVNVMAPIFVAFSLPDAAEIRRHFHDGNPIEIMVFDENKKEKLADCSLDSIDNQVDPNTGTLAMKALCPNHDARLFPNQFVNVRIKTNTLKDVFIIPTKALQYSPEGPFVFIYSEDKAIVIPIHVMTTGDQQTAFSLIPTPHQDSDATKQTTTHNAPESENTPHAHPPLTVGDLIITEGYDKLRDGAKVQRQGIPHPHDSLHSHAPHYPSGHPSDHSRKQALKGVS